MESDIKKLKSKNEKNKFEDIIKNKDLDLNDFKKEILNLNNEIDSLKSNQKQNKQINDEQLTKHQTILKEHSQLKEKEILNLNIA